MAGADEEELPVLELCGSSVKFIASYLVIVL